MPAELEVGVLLIVKDVKRSREYYEHVFNGKILEKEDPAIVRVANVLLFINNGGGPTDDKPAVTAVAPVQADHDRLSIAMNFRVADVHECYRLWKERGAHFLTEPKDHGDEIRCYIRDPDGYLIEVGQDT